MRLIRERHPDGAVALYDMYKASLYGIIARIVPDTARSEDLLQEAFIRIWQSFEQYDPAKGRLFTWMVNIARNMAIDLLRSKTYKKDLLTGELGGHEEIAVPVAAFDRADYHHVRQTAGLLKGSEKAIVDLIYYRGYTHVEAAEELKLPVGTVKTRLVRAIRRLRAHYDERPLALAS